MSCDVIYGCVKEDSTFAVLARVHVDGAIWAQADVSAIIWSAWDKTDSANPVINGASLTVADVVFDALQTDGRWTLDATGYNFLHTVAASVFTTPATYRIEYKVTLAGGAVVFLGPFEIKVEDVWTS